MDFDSEHQQRRVPSLVQLCQRAAVAHNESICSLGDDLTYKLVKPILERCSIEQLSRLEQASPHLKKNTPEIWKDLCFRKYRMTAVERYSIDDVPQEPDSWRLRYIALEEAEARRIDELGSRLRTQRMEADERKKGKEVKYTDRLPDPKRARTSTWNTPAKSLFQRTRHEASKYQRALNTRVLPPPPISINRRVLPRSTGAALPLVEPSSSRVTVKNTVIHRHPSTMPGVSSIENNVASRSSSFDTNPPARFPLTKAQTSPPITPRESLLPDDPGPTVAAKPLISPKKEKNPMSCLFVPKRTPNGQLRRLV